MRRVEIFVGASSIGEQKTWAYPSGNKSGRFSVPVYECMVLGSDGKGNRAQERFEVLRFGVQCEEGKTARVVGLADQQTHKIKAWIPTYSVHSASPNEDGAWQVFNNFLIHDGPDNSTEIFAPIGCIETGPSGFNQFNNLLISLAAQKTTYRDHQLAEIGSKVKYILRILKLVALH